MVKCQEHDFKARGRFQYRWDLKEVEKAFKHLCQMEPVEETEKRLRFLLDMKKE